MPACESLRQPYQIDSTRNMPGPADYAPYLQKQKNAPTLSASRRRFNYLRQSFSSGAVEDIPLLGPGRYTPYCKSTRICSSAQIGRYSNATTAWSLAVAGMTRDLQSEPSCQEYYHINSWKKPRLAPPMSSRNLAPQTTDEAIQFTLRIRRNETPAPGQYNVSRKFRSRSANIGGSERNMMVCQNGNPFIKQRRQEYDGCVGDYEIRNEFAQGGFRRSSAVSISRYGRNDTPVYEKSYLTQSLRIYGVNE